MSSPATPTSTNPFDAVFKTILSQIEGDAAAVVKGQLLSFFGTISANPSAGGITQAVVAIQASALTSGLAVEPVAIKQIADDGIALVNKIPSPAI